MKIMKRLDATVHGHVQGVAFRAYTQHEATRLALRGWVANQPDGSVRVVAEGDETALHALLAWLHAGPPSAHVTQVEAIWSEGTDDFHSFQVRY
jgi:acylphosphatase